jgi:hypothetical protein
MVLFGQFFIGINYSGERAGFYLDEAERFARTWQLRMKFG